MKQKKTRVYHFGAGRTHRKETTRDERVKIIALRDAAGMAWKKIAEHVNIDFRTSQGIYSRAKANSTPSNQVREGRPVIFDATEKERLRVFVMRDKRTRRLM